MLAVEAKKIRVRAYKAARLDGARQRLKLIRLDRFKERLLDARCPEHLLQSQVLGLSRSAKLGTDIRHGVSDS
jgi:hypothetical protein